ncbi:MAG: thioesterase family protein, partial [Pseudomonadota bacterium]
QGVDQSTLRADHGVVFVVAGLEARYRRPARLDDLLVVTTALEKRGAARLSLAQTVLRGAETLFESRVDIALIDIETGRPARAPAGLAAALSGGAEG